MVQVQATVTPRDYKGKNKIKYSEFRSEGDNEYTNQNLNYKLVSPLTTQFQCCLWVIVTMICTRPLLVLSILCFTIVAPVFLSPSGLCDEFRRYQHWGSKSNKLKWASSGETQYDRLTSSAPPKPTPDQCANIINVERFDCYPRGYATEESCVSRGCCWSLPTGNTNESVSDLNVPYCFYPKQYNSYRTINITVTDLGATVFLKNVFPSAYPGDINIVRMDFSYETVDRLHVKIYDAENQRFETPYPEVPVMVNAAKNTKYFVDIDKEKLGFKVVRKSNNKTIFDAQSIGGFIFADQYLQLSAKLPSKYIYGFGQQRNSFLQDTNWRQITLFNHDCPPTDKLNLYGSHPFYLLLEDGGLSSGALLHNSNAMDIILQPAPAVTYRTIGGVFDFYFFLGPSPADVVSQYTELVGRPFMPPYWGLGFHLCRFGYGTLNRTVEVWNRTRSAGIPFDTQWNDLDYMESRNDFTYDKAKFKELPSFVQHLHKIGMHYVPIIDPGISGSELPGSYPPYDEGIKDGIFIMDSTGTRPFIGKVWNEKSTVFPDFTNPAVVQYWINQMRRMHKMFEYDGAWIDMNDPSNFFSGEKNGCPNNTLEHPPYIPGVDGGALYHRTLCMSAKQYYGHHYNLHNVYGIAEAIVTSYAMRVLRNKRPFVISRSSFPGHGHYAGIWTGDIYSSWDDMHQSVSDLMSFSIFGIPLSGADICGFNGNTTAALCHRWSQLGAFYPFSRNHNSDDTIDQDPVALGNDVVAAARKALTVRYSLLPYLYTLFWRAHYYGETVVRPLFFQFPKDVKTYSITAQFLWGSGILIAPVLTESKLYASVYLPVGRWYDFYTSKPIDSNGTDYVIPAPLDTIPLILAGGNIIPTQEPNITTVHSRLNKMGLIAAGDEKGSAYGELYWDDGNTLDNNEFDVVNFTLTPNKLNSTIKYWSYKTNIILGSVQVLGVETGISVVTVNDTPHKNFTYKAEFKHLNITNLMVDLSQTFVITWK